MEVRLVSPHIFVTAGAFACGIAWAFEGLWYITEDVRFSSTAVFAEMELDWVDGRNMDQKQRGTIIYCAFGWMVMKIPNKATYQSRSNIMLQIYNASFYSPKD
jgi:phage gp29-like protein